LELWVADGTKGVGAREEKGKVVLEAGGKELWEQGD
jgi:hypothetical protein